jgi:hypothetical protein
MITVHCELKDNKLYKLVDEAFVNEAGMKKVSKGNYEGSGNNIFNSSFLAVDNLLKIKGFINNVVKFTRDVNGEEEDIFEYYDYLVSAGKL